MQRIGYLVLLGSLLMAGSTLATSPLRQPGESPPLSLEALDVEAEPAGVAPRHIPILALYTPERRDRLGGLPNLTDQLNDELRGLNQSLQVSGIFDYDFVFSAIQQADYHDSGRLADDIAWLDAAWPVARVRGAGARLVHLFVGRATDAGGVSGGMKPNYPSVSTVPEEAADGIYVLAHEVGHSLGLSHDPKHRQGFPEWTNGHGFRMAGYRDVMAYADGCQQEFGAACPTTAGYSDPARLRSGRPLGIPGVSEAVAVLRETLPFVAGDTTCAASPTALCLANHRFKVETVWRTADAATDKGQAITRTTDTGEFWFFAPTNIEVIVKVLEGCALGGHFWIFGAGLTNVHVLLKVTDTRTGEVRFYTNPQGSVFQPIQDTGAFPCE